MTPFTLRPYQEKDVKKALKSKTRGVINGSIMGAGKSLFGVEVMRRAGTRQVLIIAPLNTFDGWATTVERQAGVPLIRISSDPSTNADYAGFMDGKPGWYFINWEMAIRLPYDKFVCDGVVFDEIHRSASHELMKTVTINGKKVKRAKILSNARMGYIVGKGVAERGGYRIGLSGTWKGNKEEGAWSTQRCIWPNETDPSFWRWARRRLKIERVMVRQWPVREEAEVIGDELDPGAIVRDLPCYIRHEADSRCCKAHPNGIDADLPTRQEPRMVGVDLSVMQRRIYDQLEAEMIAWIDDNDWPLSSEGWPMVNMIRMHQVALAIPSTTLAYRIKDPHEPPESFIKVSYPLNATSSKLDALEDIIADIPDDKQFVIYTHSAGIIPAVVARLNRDRRGMENAQQPRNVAGWHGGVVGSQRAGVKRRFLDGSLRGVVAQVASIAEGVDGLQTVCHNEIWLSMSDNRLINEQAARRLHRSGQKHSINVWCIYAKGTVELDQYKRLLVDGEKMRKGLVKR